MPASSEVVLFIWSFDILGEGFASSDSENTS